VLPCKNGLQMAAGRRASGNKARQSLPFCHLDPRLSNVPTSLVRWWALSLEGPPAIDMNSRRRNTVFENHCLTYSSGHDCLSCLEPYPCAVTVIVGHLRPRNQTKACSWGLDIPMLRSRVLGVQARTGYFHSMHFPSGVCTGTMLLAGPESSPFPVRISTLPAFSHVKHTLTSLFIGHKLLRRRSHELPSLTTRSSVGGG